VSVVLSAVKVADVTVLKVPEVKSVIQLLGVCHVAAVEEVAVNT